jgi:hypothetical protein
MHLRTWPTFSVVTSCASSSSRMCFFIPVSDMPKGSASSLIVALPEPEPFEDGAAGRVGEGCESGAVFVTHVIQPTTPPPYFFWKNTSL